MRDGKKYAAKSGRIPTAAAFLGTALNMKPVMNIFDRSITTAAKCRGERKLVEKVAEMSIAAMEPGSPSVPSGSGVQLLS